MGLKCENVQSSLWNEVLVSEHQKARRKLSFISFVVVVVLQFRNSIFSLLFFVFGFDLGLCFVLVFFVVLFGQLLF